jgi:aryl-alcohol dehydrogenase-like predicted oxidoreductase
MVKKKQLGNTNLEVTELCFGALPMGPLQSNVPAEEGAKLILEALRKGVNFIDTAERYQTYSHIRKAIELFEGEVIIATKSPAETYDEMERSIQLALDALGREQIEIFLMHAARVSPNVFEERAGALQCLMDYKKKGVLKAIGISTHVVSVVERSAEIEELDIVFPIINKLGMGIVGGSIEEMLQAIDKVYHAGKGLYAMKALAGGHLITEVQSAFDYVRAIPGISSVAVGMVAPEELAVNLALFNDEGLPEGIKVEKVKAKKRLHVMGFCKGCGTCTEACPNAALSLVNGKAQVDTSQCILCGYCNPVCPEFALRLI